MPHCIKQVDAKGCGIAAVATVTGHTYQNVRRVARETRCWRESYGMSGGMMTRLLDRYRRPVRRVTMGRQPLLPIASRTAIVKVTARVPCTVLRNGKSEKRTRLWQHWVVWSNRKVWDPGAGVLWGFDDVHAIDGMKLYLASVKAPGSKITHVRTGRWHWV